MRKKILSIWMCIALLFLWWSEVFWSQIKVENIFSDIDANYPYKQQLQILYDNGIIAPDEEGKLHPYQLLSREEFVGIVMEVSCNDCIQPGVSWELIQKYTQKQSFYDVWLQNDYFYCIADANENGIVSWYESWTTCEDGTVSSNQKPFCPQNTIVLEEALAVILRASGILTEQQARDVRTKIGLWDITQPLSDDVFPKNLDGSVYSFYPDFQKALEYQVLEYDLEGNQIIHKLIEKENNKLRPKSSITKEDFIKIAAVALRANSCKNTEKSQLPIQVGVYNKSCDSNMSSCEKSDLDDTWNTYDFIWTTITQCEQWISDPQWYIWRFENQENGQQYFENGQYLDNYTFPYSGRWKVYLRIIDNCWNTSESFQFIWVQNGLQIGIDTDLLWNNEIGFSAQLEWWNGRYQYNWDFWDATSGNGKDVSHIYDIPGTYEVQLSVTDSTWNTQVIDKTIVIGQEGQISLWIDAEISQEEKDYSVYFEPDIVWGNGEYSYVWDFWDGKTSTQENPTHDYENNGVYDVSLVVTDENGSEVSAHTLVHLNHDQDSVMSVIVQADVISSTGSLATTLIGSITGGVGPYTYEWDLWDGTTAFGNNYEYVYSTPGTYLVELLVTDSLWVEAISQIYLTVLSGTWLDNDWDADTDGVKNSDDKCPTIVGVQANQWCPIFDQTCSLNSDCNQWYYCDTSVSPGRCAPQKTPESCEYVWNSSIYAGAVCNSCPCSVSLDFNASLRNCDIIFPAITSPDGTQFYSRGDYVQIQK